MADGLGDDRAAAGEEAGEPTLAPGDEQPLTVFADTLPAPVPSIDDGHPIDLDAPKALRPGWVDRVLGTVLGKAVAAMNPNGDRMAP